MMKDPIRSFDRWVAEIEAAALEGMEEAAPIIEGVAIATTAYNDDTGATRAATVAYVATARGGGAARMRRAAAEVRRLRFDARQVELTTAEGPTGPDISIILTVPTTYVIGLETLYAGDHAFIRPTILAESGPAFQRVMDTIRRRAFS